MPESFFPPSLAASVTLDRGRTRARALRSLTRRCLAQSGWFKAARWLGLGIALGVGGLMVALRFGTAATDLTPLLQRGLIALSWIGGGLAVLGLTRRDPDPAGHGGIAALLGQRGFAPSAVSRAGWIASFGVVAAALTPPGLVLASVLLPLSREMADLPVAAAALVGTALYLLVTSGALAALARVSLVLGPGRPRLTLLTLTLGPELLRAAGLGVPSVPALLAVLLERIFALGTGS